MEATSIDSGGNTPAEAPATFAEAFAADASPASDSPSSDATTPSAAEQPTQANEATPSTGDDRSPFIPRARFDEVNAKKTAAEQWKEQYAWAEKIDQGTMTEAIALAQRYKGDPIGFLQELAAEIQAHPEHGARLRSFAAQQLAAGRGQAAPAAPNYDQIQIDLGDGRAVSLGEIQQQWLAKVREELSPVLKSVEQTNAERAQLKAQADADAFAGSTMQDVSTWPGMDNPANRKAVGDAIKAMQLTSDDPRDLQLALSKAWRQVVLPQIHSSAQSQLMDNLKTKAAASSVNPGSASPSTPKQYTSFNQLPEDAWK